MAIGVTKPVAGVYDTTNTNAYTTGSFTPTANSLLICFVVARGTQAAGTMTGGSLSWSQIDALNYNTNLDRAMIFKALVGGSPGSMTITFDCTGDNATGCVMQVLEFTGQDGVTVQQTKITAGSGANPALTFNSALNTNNGYGIAGNHHNNTANQWAPPASWSEGEEGVYSTPSTSGMISYRAGGETTTGPYTFTNAQTTTWVLLGVEVPIPGTGHPAMRRFGGFPRPGRPAGVRVW